MSNRNAYFQIGVKEHATYLRLFPAVGDGKALKIDEILAFFLRHHIQSHKMVEISEVLKKLKDSPIEMRILDEEVLPISESVSVKISEDRMTATGVFYPPSTHGKLTDKRDILDDLKRAGVNFGVDEAVIDDFLQNREYCKEFVLARGMKHRDGTDAVFTYYFNTKPSYQPMENEDGTVDFHKLNFVNNVQEGDVLVTLVPADLGDHGRDVTGRDLPPKKIADRRILAGKNTRLEDEGKTLVATMSGHVVLDIDNKVVVSNVLQIDGDIDTSTGDITYDGNVIIKGNVNTGYRVDATGNIEIDGVVEGATIIAGGDIVLRRGIQGMNKGYLKAGGNLMTKFIENASVVVRGKIESGSILHSDVISKSEITVRGRKGLLVGGSVRANVLIEAQSIGSNMGSNTKVSVGIDAEVQDKIRKLTEELKGLQAEEYRTRQLLELLRAKQQQGTLTKEHIAALPKTVQHYTELKERIETIDNEIMEDSLNIEDSIENARIVVRDRMYPGVTISIAGEYSTVHEMARFCKYIKQGGEIKRIPL